MRNPPATGAEVGVVVGAADAPGTTTRIGPGVTRTRAGAAVGAAGAGAAAGATGEDIERKTSLACPVVSAPHSGQLTGAGMRPFTGSTSNLNFVPHSQTTLSSINASGLTPSSQWQPAKKVKAEQTPPAPPFFRFSDFGFRPCIVARELLHFEANEPLAFTYDT
jgi:hypothetical protein